jgi:hypothetical protein
MLSTSTSSEGRPAEANDFAASERQQATGDVPECPIPVACDQNSDGEIARGDSISTRLREAANRWTADRNRRVLRMALLELIRSLDD